MNKDELVMDLPNELMAWPMYRVWYGHQPGFVRTLGKYTCRLGGIVLKSVS